MLPSNHPDYHPYRRIKVPKLNLDMPGAQELRSKFLKLRRGELSIDDLEGDIIAESSGSDREGSVDTVSTDRSLGCCGEKSS